MHSRERIGDIFGTLCSMAVLGYFLLGAVMFAVRIGGFLDHLLRIVL